MREDDTGRRVGRIVEVEAYIHPDDRASHARFGPTARNRVMWGPPGIAYVYLVYGMYDCLNIVTEPAGSPAAVLVRAVEPLEGADRMRTDRRMLLATRRRRPVAPAEGATPTALDRLPVHRLAAGPGLVAAAFGVDTRWTGTDLCDPGSPLRLEPQPPGEGPLAVRATPRIGIGYAGEPWTSLPWRFVIEGHRAASGPASLR